MKAYDLLTKASFNLSDYTGKKYKVTKGAVIDKAGREYQEFKLNSERDVCVDEYLRGYISGFTEVEEISQEVSFLEAVKAYNEGKTIRCEIKNSCIPARIYKPKYPGSNVNPMIDVIGTAVNTKEILEGLWYLEDSNE